ncbi:MAG: sn-glycerol-3-phosphate ABC transporter ATP-binding protein UgpC [Hyphomicrobiales bacterium]
MTDIRISKLHKSFGHVGVLNDINIEIADGEFLVLVGPSGCGKSTLLRIISGLEQVTSGTIHIGGRDVTDLPAKARDIAMVFQSYALYPHMTVAENMGFSLKLRGETRAVIAERVKKAAETLGLTGYLDRKPSALSGGQRQRVAMGRAIVRDPKVFLFDEPLSNLDAQLRVAMRGEIKALHQRLKTTVVYVTHDQVEAMTMADRIVVLRNGVVEQIGSPLELFDNPANVFVAQFIGSPAMNLFAGRIVSDRGKASVALDLGASVFLPAGTRVGEGQRVSLGVRPEHFLIADQEGSLVANVDVVEPLGSQMQVGFSCAAQSIIAIFNERLACSPGETMKLVPRTDSLHLFDAGSGERIATGG